MIPQMLVTLLAAATLFIAPVADARKISKAQLHAKQVEASQRFRIGSNDAKKSGGVQNITFSNPKASRELSISAHVYVDELNFINITEFWVNGSAIPEVDFDIGPSWSGLLPISNKTGETREVCRRIWTSRNCLLIIS